MASSSFKLKSKQSFCHVSSLAASTEETMQPNIKARTKSEQGFSQFDLMKKIPASNTLME
jgi:hypothetical protein